MLVNRYGKIWDIDDDEKKGQLGLLKEDHYRSLFYEAHIPSSLKKDDVWLDIGANIGAFAIRAAEYVDFVVAVEPEIENLRALRTNIMLNDVRNISIAEAVIVGGHEPTASLSLSNSYSSTHRIGKIRGRRSIEVTAYNINDFVAMNHINKIKMDCEGTEAEILEALHLSPIQEIVFEYHFTYLKDESWVRFNAILDSLRAAGFTILKAPIAHSKTWHTIVWAKRPPC